MIEFVVPGIPVCKERPRIGRGGHVYTPSKTMGYERAVRTLAAAAGAQPGREPVAVTLQFFVPDARRRDIDNLCKSALDGLNKTAFADDSQIVELHAYKAIDREYPRAAVRVEAAAGSNFNARAGGATSRRIVRKDAPQTKCGDKEAA